MHAFLVSLRIWRYAHINEQTPSRSQRCLSVVRTPLTRSCSDIQFQHIYIRYEWILRQISESASYHPHNSLFRLSSPAVPGTMIPHCHIQPRYLILWSGVPSLLKEYTGTTFVHLYSFFRAFSSWRNTRQKLRYQHWLECHHEEKVVHDPLQ
jgi:hypothetical protein